MKNVLAWLWGYWPQAVAILVLVLPSIITGLSKYPKAQGFLRFVLDLLSWLQHRDSPGRRISMPFLRSTPPKGCKPYKWRNGAAVAVVVPWLAVGTALAATPSCCWLRKDCPEPVQDALDCAAESIKTHVSNLLPVVSEILAGSDAWVASLTSLALEVGADAVDCAVHAIMDNYQAKATDMKASPAEFAATKKVLDRGAEWLKTHPRAAK